MTIYTDHRSAWCDEHGEMDYLVIGDPPVLAWVMCNGCRNRPTDPPSQPPRERESHE